MKCHVRQWQYEPFVDEVELIEANPNYAHIRHNDGRETTVSLHNLAPCVLLESINPLASQPVSQGISPLEVLSETNLKDTLPPISEDSQNFVLSRSHRTRHAPERLHLYLYLLFLYPHNSMSGGECYFEVAER